MSNNINPPSNLDTTWSTSEIGLAVKAIVIASLAKILGGLVLGAIIAFIYVIYQIDNGMSQSEIDSIAKNIDLLSTFGIVCSSVGFILSFYAGYLCAAISETNIYRNSAVVFLISICFTLFVGADSFVLIEDLVLAVISLVGIFLGAYTFKKKLV